MSTVAGRSLERISRSGGAQHDQFARLLPEADWGLLPAAVRRRFSQPLAAASSVVFAGEVESTRLTLAGRWFGQLARLIGAPLPLSAGDRTAACVIVTNDGQDHSQRWTRLYARPGQSSQVIHSTKRFAGITGLEECVGAGVGMRLRLAVEHRALVFRSVGFFVRVGRLTVPIPAWLTPGVVEVVHREERDGRFSFELCVTHPWFGRIIHQVAFFTDRPAPR